MLHGFRYAITLWIQGIWFPPWSDMLSDKKFSYLEDIFLPQWATESVLSFASDSARRRWGVKATVPIRFLPTDSWTSVWPMGSPITRGDEICQVSLWEQLVWGCYLCVTGWGTTKGTWRIWDDVGWLLQKLQISSNPSCRHPTNPLHGKWRHMTSPCCKSHGVFTKLLIIVKKCKSLTIYSKSW